MAQHVRQRAASPAATSGDPVRPRFSLSALLHRWEIPEDAIIIGSALVVGIGAGLSAALFNWATYQVRNLTLLATELVGLATGVMASMIAAGLIVGLIVRYWTPEVRGSGVPEVMEAVAIRNGLHREQTIREQTIRERANREQTSREEAEDDRP
jgi:H+/Cl- antiporter ClcA